ncbi:MAG: small multi-drug export protein [Candidatus Aenigmarchaeota archaeon]|nr:small multi-drug export protein [Candidatus Aenigmarchaeota archaeon]
MLEETMAVIIANIIPTGEQIVGIPLGVALGLDPVYSFLVSLCVNCALFFPIYFGLKIFYDKVFSRIKIFNRYLEKARKKGQPYVDKYGVLGLTLFISLPTPLTGTYTASILSWLLNLDWKKSFIAIAIGSTIGGLIILSTILGFIEVLKFLVSV